MKIHSFFYSTFFFAILFSSCTKDEALKAEIDTDASIKVSNIGADAVNINFTNIDDERGHTLTITNKENGKQIHSSQISNNPRFKNLESGQNYLAQIIVDGYEDSPYESVEFTTLPFDYILSSNIGESGRFQTETGFDVELTTDAGKGNKLVNYELFLVDDENEDSQIKLTVTRKDEKLTFKILEDFVPIPNAYQKTFTLMYSLNGREKNSVKFNLGNSIKNSTSLRINYKDTYIGKKISQTRKRKSECGDNDVFRIGFEGYFYWLRGGEESVILTNLDNSTELILKKELEDSCHNFRFGIIEKNNAWKGLLKSSLYIEFLESEAQGLVPGNYAIKINYDLDDGFHESNTFEFVVEE